MTTHAHTRASLESEIH